MAEGQNRLAPRAATAYQGQGPGIGAEDDTLDWLEENTDYRITREHCVLDVGFGKGKLLKRLAEERSCSFVAGVDIAEASLEESSEWKSGTSMLDTTIDLRKLDVSHDLLPFRNDAFDFAICTETIEHVANPHHMVAEIKRVLKNHGILVMAFPMPEDNLGYGCGQHAHMYPGFLTRGSFEMFMQQCFFRKIQRTVNGSTAWYCYENYKGSSVVDVFTVVSGNYTEYDLFKCIGARKLDAKRPLISYDDERQIVRIGEREIAYVDIT